MEWNREGAKAVADKIFREQHKQETEAAIRLEVALSELTDDGYFVLGGPRGEILLQAPDGRLIHQIAFNRSLNIWAITDLRHELKDPNKEH